MTFGVTKFLLLYGIQDTKHISLLKENIIPIDQSFNMSSTNFNLAIQIRPVDWTNPQANLSQYLQIIAEEHSWDQIEDSGQFNIKQIKKKLRNCQMEDFKFFNQFRSK